MGVHRTTVIAWEDGTKEPHPDLYPKIRRVLDNQDSNLFDICQKTSQSHQLSAPCQVTTNRAILESTSPHVVITGTVGGFKEFMDMLRRQFMEAVARSGLTAAFGGLSLGLVSSPSVDPEDYLDICSESVGTWWGWLNQGCYHHLERVLLKHAPLLKRLAYTDSPFQNMAAALAAQTKFMQIILAGHRLDFVNHEIHCVEAARFGALSGNRNLQAVAQGYLGHHHTLYVPDSDKAIDAFNRGLACVYSDNSLQISILYMGLSGAYAQEGNEIKAREYAEMARLTMPDYPELNPFYRLIDIGSLELSLLEARTYLTLHEHFPQGDYSQKARDAFEQAANKQAISNRTQSEALICQADAARAHGDMDECLTCLADGFRVGDEIKSLKRISEAGDVIGNMPKKWKYETTVQELQKAIINAIQELQKDRSNAIVVARR